jgi:hypothetical protein
MAGERICISVIKRLEREGRKKKKKKKKERLLEWCLERHSIHVTVYSGDARANEWYLS